VVVACGGGVGDGVCETLKLTWPKKARRRSSACAQVRSKLRTHLWPVNRTRIPRIWVVGRCECGRVEDTPRSRYSRAGDGVPHNRVCLVVQQTAPVCHFGEEHVVLLGVGVIHDRTAPCPRAPCTRRVGRRNQRLHDVRSAPLQCQLLARRPLPARAAAAHVVDWMDMENVSAGCTVEASHMHVASDIGCVVEGWVRFNIATYMAGVHVLRTTLF
jgi:hypothetical protein